MSLSKEEVTAATTTEPRQPKCARCRQHGIIVRQKGHTRVCPFLRCDCWKCFLIAERTRITALQRNLKRGRRAAAEGALSTRSAPGDARPSAASPQCAGAPESGTAPGDRTQLDVKGEPGPGPGAGGDTRGDTREGREITPDGAPYFGEFGQSAPLPVIHFPFRMGGHYLRSYVPCPNLMPNMPWLPPVPAGLYNQGLCRPIMLPLFQQGALHYPPPLEPGPPADCRQVLFTLQPPPLPEAFQQEQHMQPPVAKHAELDIVELD